MSNWRWKRWAWDKPSKQACCAAVNPPASPSLWENGSGGTDMPTFGEVAERLRRSTVQVFSGEANRGGGSGVIWDDAGLIVTNAHVARSMNPTVELWDGQRCQARLVSH